VNHQVLTVDIGNAHLGSQLWSHKEDGWQATQSGVHPDRLHPEIPVIFSSVTHQIPEHPKAINSRRFFQENQFLDMPVHYGQTLGMDRLVQAYFLYQHIQPTDLPIFLIDMGTFTTVDIIDRDGLQGGHILPGVGILKECYLRGAQLELPRVSDLKLQECIPSSTTEAIEQGLLAAILGPLTFLLEKYPACPIHFSGGASSILENSLKQILPKHELNFHRQLIHHSLLSIYQQLEQESLL
jgi:pantothenate kinase type III